MKQRWRNGAWGAPWRGDALPGLLVRVGRPAPRGVPGARPAHGRACRVLPLLLAAALSAGADPSTSAPPAMAATGIATAAVATASATPPAAPDAAVADLLARGAAQRRAKDSAGAIATYERVLQLDPRNDTASALLATLLFTEARSAPCGQAIALLEKALRCADDPAIRQELVRALARCGRRKDALARYEELPDRAALPPDLLTLMADCYREEKLLATAETLYRDALRANPDDAPAVLGLALTLQDDGRCAEAIAVADQGLAQQPDAPLLLFARAAAQWKSGARADALDSFDRILQRDPANADAVNLKAQLLAEMGCVSLAGAWAAAHQGLMRPGVTAFIERAAAAARRTWSEGSPPASNASPRLVSERLVALCYHDVPAAIPAPAAGASSRDPLAVALPTLVQHLEYLRQHNYHFIRADDLRAAVRRERPLPEQAVLLTFDHGYASFLTNVLPVLELYDCPALLSICTEWIDQPPAQRPAPLLSWEQIRALGRHRLVTVASATHALHVRVPANPQGDRAPAAVTRQCLPPGSAYETEDAYRRRLAQDLRASAAALQAKAGVSARILVWPYGARNAGAEEEARHAGFDLTLGLGRAGALTDTRDRIRLQVAGNVAVAEWAPLLVRPAEGALPTVRHAIRVSLDLVYDPAPPQEEANLTRFLARVRALGVNTVYLDAFSDVDRDEAAEGVYFPSRVLPMRQDLFDHVAACLRDAGVAVYACMPVLGLDLPRAARRDSLAVMEYTAGAIRPSLAVQARLSPFSADAVRLIRQLYEELATRTRFDGLLFRDDAFLTDNEDFNAEAIRAATAAGLPAPGTAALTADQARQWMRLKTSRLNDLTAELMDGVRQHAPQARFARCIYAPVLHHPESEAWFAQNYADALRLYDEVVLLAYAEAEHVRRPDAWLEGLVRTAAAQPDGLARTVFDLQSYDRSRARWIEGAELAARLDRLVRSGATRFAYGPDDYALDRPEREALGRRMSALPAGNG